MTSYAPPTCTPDQAADLRKDLEASGWGVDAVGHLLGEVADAALRREVRLPALRALHRVLAEDRAAGATPTPTAVLTALFMLGQAVPASELDWALRRTRTAGAVAMGLVEHLPAGAEALTLGEVGDAALVRACVDLRPHEVAGLGKDGADLRWWVASDLGELETGRALEPDHVLGIGGAGLTLASLTPRRPVRTALDLGCGCGIQTLYLLQHCEHVVATDVSARALAFTAFNAALCGADPQQLELVEGSFLEPVAGRRFDLIATNPPFVLTPLAVREAGLPLMEYRDAGRPVLPELVPALGEHLEVGGSVVMLGNWEHHRFQDWRERVSAWLPADVDAWVIERETQDPVEYATMWLRDGGAVPERDLTGFEAALEAWIADFEEREVEEIGFGYLVLHRPDPEHDGAPRQPWRVLEEVGTQPAGPLAEHLARSVEVRSGLAAMDDEQVALLHPVLAPDVTEERHLRPGEAEPTLILLRQGGGFARTIQADTALAALAGVADGELSVAQVADAVAALLQVDAQALRAEMVQATRRLAADGFVEL
ncbi:DUF7059 domain-containing protein [Actinomyces faecalis]|uniref:DUF7059 domain-containing protein n=1 Tax=Actinomyces faecalis TaxID=2722820 RepID=UPI0015540223|nr:class I SAM-dependent methyltransferase [Actinomyces faecalis]